MKRSHIIPVVVAFAFLTVGAREATAATPLFQEPSAEEAYRAARSLLNSGSYENAAAEFQALREAYRSNAINGETFYWEAFARYRMGQVRRALQLLEQQRADFPRARTITEARALLNRICGDLASQGDEGCARQLAEESRDSSGISEEARLMALNALTNMRPERAMPLLRRAMVNDDRSPQFRQQVMYLISEKAEPAEATDLLLRAANEDPDRRVRQQAVFWLSEVNSEAAVDGLLELLDNSTDDDLLRQVVFSLSQHESPRAMQAVRRLIGRSNVSDEVRGQAIYWLGEEGTDEDLVMLRNLYGDVGQRLRQQILYAIAEAGGPDNQQWLLDLALNQDIPTDQRKTALYHVAESGASIDRLISLYDSIPELEMRRQLIWVISQSDTEAALTKMIDIARSDPDPELREQAIFWLGNSEDPRAMDFLIELLEQ